MENEALTEMIEDIFHENKARYGSRRIQKILEQQGVHVNSKRVCRLMSEHSVIAKGTRKYYKYQANKATYDEKENMLNQVFKSSKKSNMGWRYNLYTNRTRLVVSGGFYRYLFP